MRIAIIGYGKMGKAIEKLALEKNHKVILSIDNEKDWEEKQDELKSCDVAIEFSTPETVLSNIKKCFEINLPIITGTTGWHNQINEVKSWCKEYNASLFYASNFSVGVHIFFKINTALAEIVNNFNQYDVSLTEKHHTQKLDSPSGTAINLLQQIIDKHQGKRTWEEGESTDKNTIPVESIREGDIIGTHSIKWESDVDSIKIKHKAKTRDGFALGAIQAAEWVKDKKGVFTMDDMLFKKN
jgi:4-hydroxy-tetrahydrodipicolinate reductase